MTDPADSESFQQKLGQRLLKLRGHVGLTQRELAKAAETTAACISQLERGQRGPSAELIVRLAGALGVTPDAIMLAPTEPQGTAEAVSMLVRQMPETQQAEVMVFCRYLAFRRKQSSADA